MVVFLNHFFFSSLLSFWTFHDCTCNIRLAGQLRGHGFPWVDGVGWNAQEGWINFLSYVCSYHNVFYISFPFVLSIYHVVLD